MTTSISAEATDLGAPTFLWLEVTGRCQLRCGHCYADSGPGGTDGSMTRADWIRIINQAADLGVRAVQFIGGEPTLYESLPELINHALSRALGVEVFTNLVHVTEAMWEVFEQPDVSLATSYYSDDPDQHAAITARPSHARTRANIAKALRRGIPLRAGVVDVQDGQRAAAAQKELADLGVPRVGYDRLRQIGRGGRDQRQSAKQLCGACGHGAAAVRPDGQVTPCVMARWQSIGNVLEADLATVISGLPKARTELIEQGMPNRPVVAPCGPNCTPTTSGTECYPHNCHPR